MVRPVKGLFYLFASKKPRSGVAEHEGEEKNISGEIAGGVLRKSIIRSYKIVSFRSIKDYDIPGEFTTLCKWVGDKKVDSYSGL